MKNNHPHKESLKLVVLFFAIIILSLLVMVTDVYLVFNPVQTAPPSPAPTAPPINETQRVIDSVVPLINGTISYCLQSMQDNLERNPHLATQIQAKIDMLQDPALESRIIGGGYFAVDFVPSIDGRQIPIAAIFTEEIMRSDAAEAVRWIKIGTQILENFTSTPFPTDQTRIWYGFIIGNQGGWGVIFTEDQTTYESRWSDGLTPYEPIIYHELSHSYIGHESLNQFLELYQYNVVHANSTDYSDWVNHRVPPENWPWITAILNIYQLIGRDAMANAYKTFCDINPPYGTPLSEECKQVFVDQAPEDLKSQVAALAAEIVY